MLYKEARVDKGAYTEHTCNDRWASEEDDPSPEGNLPAQRSMSKWRYMCLGDLSLCDKNAWRFFA